jgi:hypothetical protein
VERDDQQRAIAQTAALRDRSHQCFLFAIGHMAHRLGRAWNEL